MSVRDERLALIAIGALAVYVLACQPGFSPDGSRVVVTAAGGPHGQGHVLVYDRPSQKWTTLLSVGKLEGNGAPLITARWSPDGHAVVAAWGLDEHAVQVAVLPADGTGPVRLFRVDQLDEALPALIVPPALVVPPGRPTPCLLFGGNAITALDLVSGDIERHNLPDPQGTNAPRQAIYLFGQGPDVFYLLGADQAVEVGRLDPASLRPSPLLWLPPDKNDGSPFLAMTTSGTRLALTRGDADNQSLVLYRQFQPERTLSFGATNNGLVLGNLAWSPDGRTLYAAGFRPLKPGPIAKAIHAGYEALRSAGLKPTEPRALDLQISVCEIPADGQPLRETPLFRTATAADKTFLLLYQVALSPDGKTLALSAGLSEEEGATRERDRALYLIDLTRASRPVSKIRIPRENVVPAGQLAK